ncbi:hypothetical protein M405DRAFT_869879 [Rhizopogon salebrosus TDB-379]|nr:hypothetical protein M405DRAFT_869879 [Rhizopogon salebrosus TDB-379]
MQALLTAHSKSEHFNPATPNADLVASRRIQHDEVGLVRAICVKECSSAQHKELFNNIQLRDEDGHIPSDVLKQLLMDMKVRWSSTYVMLERVEKLKDDVDYFVGWMGLLEKDPQK